MASGKSESGSAAPLLNVECSDKIAVITPQGDMGEFVVSQIQEEAETALKKFQDSNQCQHVVIDFCNTDYFGSSALGMFIRLWKRVRERGGRMALCNLSEHEKEVLKITRLNEFWSIAETLDDAKADVGR